jgi:hypothetical protein
MQYAQANGATFGEALLGGALSFFGAGFGQIAGAGISNAGVQMMVQGAVAGAFTGGINAAMNGGNFFRGALKGALSGMAMAMVSAAANEAVDAMQPETVTVKGLHGSDPNAPEDGDAGNPDDPSSPQLKKARIEAAGQLPHVKNESSYILYDKGNGEVGRSDILPGNIDSIKDFEAVRYKGKTELMTKPGKYGIDGIYRILEVIHFHPDTSGVMFSGGWKTGDVYLAESLKINVSLVHGEELRLYIPTGKVNFKYEISPASGITICKGCFTPKK